MNFWKVIINIAMINFINLCIDTKNLRVDLCNLLNRWGVNINTQLINSNHIQTLRNSPSGLYRFTLKLRVRINLIFLLYVKLLTGNSRACMFMYSKQM